MEQTSIAYWLNKLPAKISVCDGTMADGTYWLTIQKRKENWSVFYKGETFVKIYIKNGDLGLALTYMWAELRKEGYLNDDDD